MKIKKWLLALAAFAVMTVVCAVAACAETYGDYTYCILKGGTVKIIDYNGSDTTVNIPESIEGKSVTSIGDSAFRDCSNLKNITLPDSVTSIGYMAFYGCSSLTNITIPDGVTSIDKYTFNGCSSLTSITIPDSVASIGNYAFYDCSSLTSIKLPEVYAKVLSRVVQVLQV